MNKGNSAAIALTSLLAALAACDNSLNQDTAVMHYSFGTFDSRSTASISGQNSIIVINGDTVRVRGGTLSVNGVSYGKVNEDDLVEYQVRNGEKILTVNGVARSPS